MTRSQEVFLDLLRCGLWGTPLNKAFFGEANDDRDANSPSNLGKMSALSHEEWREVVDIATDQTVTGLVFDALLTLPKALRPPKDIYFNQVMRVGEMEEGNRRMNQMVAFLFQGFAKAGIDALLLKGQAAARCYPQPLHRQYGDIDIMIPDNQGFEKAVKLMQRLTGDEGDAERPRRHVAFVYKDICIEIQGLNVYGIGRRCHQNYMEWARESLRNGKQQKISAVLPPVRFEFMFIFVHLMNHFFDGGVGLRQFCDWMRYLHSMREVIDTALLKADLERLGLMRHWQTMASAAVCFLGASKDVIPFYDASFDEKAPLVMSHIFKSGNFGSLRENIFEGDRTPTMVKRFGTLLSLIPAYGRVGRLFPADACLSFYRYALRRL